MDQVIDDHFPKLTNIHLYRLKNRFTSYHLNRLNMKMTMLQDKAFVEIHDEIKREPDFETKQRMIETHIETNIRYFKPKFVKNLEKFLRLQKIIKQNENRIRLESKKISKVNKKKSHGIWSTNQSRWTVI